MSDFNYTMMFRPENSSLVDGVWYNENTLELVVNLGGSIYAYTGVPRERFNDFAAAQSAGGEYQSIKRDFGPGRYMGHEYELYFLYEFPKRTESVGTPKALTDNTNDNLTVINMTSPGLVTLGNQGDSETTASTEDAIRHTVNFVIDGSLFSHTVHAGSVGEAVGALNEVMHSLGMIRRVKVKEVVTHFDN